MSNDKQLLADRQAAGPAKFVRLVITLSLISVAFFFTLTMGGCAVPKERPQDDSPSTTDVEDPGSRFSSAQTGLAVELTGILAIVNTQDCPLVEGCGPKYRIFSEDFDDRIPLLGDISDDHSDQLIKVQGVWTFLSDEESRGLNRDAGDAAVKVASYEILSPLKYRDFLIDEADQYTVENYGCSSLWDKSFRWRTNNDQLTLIVRLTESSLAREPLPYLELWFDANSRALTTESASSDGVDPCQATLQQ